MTNSKIPATVMIFTLNEELNLPACIDSVREFDDVVVVDSFSSDGTEYIARKSGVRFVQHAFTGFGDQRNWALKHAAKHEWTLILDADERVPDALAEEIRLIASSASESIGAYRLRRRFYLWGKWLRFSSLYPTWVVRLVRKGRVQFINRGHAETQIVDGQIESLRNDLLDENLKGMEDWIQRHENYSAKEATFEIECENSAMDMSRLLSKDPLMRRAFFKRIAMCLPARGVAYFIYSYGLRLGFLDGIAGLRFCLLKSKYQQKIAMKKKMLKQGKPDR